MPTSDRLAELGYGPRWEALFAEHLSRGLLPGRVIRSDRGSALVATEHDVVRAKPSTRLLKAAQRSWDLPAVGDWVALRATTDLDVPLIEAVLDRTSSIARGSSGGTSDVQVLSANVDVVFVVHPIAQAPNLRRIERELSLAWESGARPVVVLTKADLSADVEMACRSVEEVAFGVDVVTTNALAADGACPLTDFIVGRYTAVLIGPSGAGKSTLVNALLGEARQATREVRLGDGRGRHTTVVRELIAIPSGGVLIDTPGLRALSTSPTPVIVPGGRQAQPGAWSAPGGCHGDRHNRKEHAMTDVQGLYFLYGALTSDDIGPLFAHQEAYSYQDLART